MDEAKREARRKLLAEIKGPWDSEKLEAVLSAPPQPPSPEVQAAVDAAAARFDEEVGAPISVPTMDELDSAWDEEEEEDEEGTDPDDGESEPELPDESADPALYAEAKRARDERVEARRERRRAKVEAKKARRKARAEAAKGKQKAKTKKARAAAASAKLPTPARAKARDEQAAEEPTPDEVVERSAAAPSAVSAEARPRAPLSSTNTWLLGIGVAIFLAAAIAAAVIFR